MWAGLVPNRHTADGEHDSFRIARENALLSRKVKSLVLASAMTFMLLLTTAIAYSRGSDAVKIDHH